MLLELIHPFYFLYILDACNLLDSGNLFFREVQTENLS